MQGAHTTIDILVTSVCWRQLELITWYTHYFVLVLWQDKTGQGKVGQGRVGGGGRVQRGQGAGVCVVFVGVMRQEALVCSQKYFTLHHDYFPKARDD